MSLDVRKTGRPDPATAPPKVAKKDAGTQVGAAAVRAARDVSGVAGKARVNEALAAGLSVPGLSDMEDLIDKAWTKVTRQANKAVETTVTAVNDVARFTRRTMSDVVDKVKNNKVTRFFSNAINFLTPSQFQIDQVKRAVKLLADDPGKFFNKVKEKAVRLYVSDSPITDRIRVLSDPPDVNPPTPEVRERLKRLKAEGKVHLHPHAFEELDKLEAACKAADAQARKDLVNPTLKAATDKAVSGLSALEKEQYTQLSKQLEGNPRALAGLQKLAREGKLTSKDLKGGRSLMHHLHAIGTQPVPQSVKKAGQTDLLAHTVMELAQPDAIAQKGRNTCAATCLQHMMASHHPAEYARLIAGLSSIQGEVRMMNNKSLKRNDQWTSDEDWSSRNGNVRSISSRLLQPALMHYGGTFKYDNVSDGHVLPGINKSIMGMLPYEIANTYQALTGKDYNADIFIDNAKRERVLKGATPERPVLLAINYAEEKGELGPHWLQIVGYDEKRKEMIAINPRGNTEAVPLDIAKSHFLSVVYPE